MFFDLSDVNGVAVDSRLVEKNFIFVAINGSNEDGSKYITQAIERGATTIVHQNQIFDKCEGVKYIQVENSRIALAEIVKILYPLQPKFILGVTGTNGKTSVAHFINEILQSLSISAVSIGTLGVKGSIEMNSGLTTPSMIELHKILQEVKKLAIDYAALECSSHGIDQRRLDLVKFHACGFTSFSQDHLDYHKNMEEYFATKCKLFSLYKNNFAVLNADIPEFKVLHELCLKNNHKIIAYGKNFVSDAAYNIQIKSILAEGKYQLVSWKINHQLFESKIPLIGEFQIYNLSCAIGLLLSCGINLVQIMKTLDHIRSVTGRMELVTSFKGANIYIDYAHTPDGLEQVLKTLRNITKGKISLVFGCGGERDQSKRYKMGETATKFADRIIITDDNPRNENPEEIRKQILAAIGDKAVEIGDREAAISFAIKQLQPNDNLLIAGKGHEEYQLIGNKKIIFSDRNKILDITNK